MHNHMYLPSQDYNNQSVDQYTIVIMNSSEISHRVKEELAEALLLSVIAKNQEEIDRGTLVILHHQAQKGYIIYLLHFINQNLPSVSNLQIEILVSSSFAQLKVLARNHWFQSEHEKNMTIPPQDKQYFLNSVIQTAFNIGSVDTHRLKYKYMKLFKDVLELICAQSIIIAPQLIESIKISLQSKTMYFVLPVYLNILLAFNNNMSLYLNGKYFEQYLQITKQFHAIMYQFVQDGSAEIQSLYEEIEANISNQELLQVKLQQYNLFKRNYEQILYLCIKYIYKSARKADKLRSIVLDWIPIAIERIEFIDQAFTKESNHSESFSKSMGEKGNDEFNYFHSKKWALKLLDISIDKILVYSAEDNHAFHQVNLFYYKNCNQIIALFKNIWNYLWPERITFQLLVCFENFIRKKPQKLAEQQQSLLLKYQRQILLPFMYINSKQISILQQNPSQFIVRQGLIKFANGFVSYRVAAFNIWISIANIEKYYCQSTCNKGKYLKSSLHLLKQWLQVFDYSRLQLRDTACLLLIKLAEYYSVTHLREQLYVLVNNVIQHNMQNLTGQHYMLAVRTLQLIKIADRRLYPALIPQSRSLIITIFNGYTQQSLLSNSSIFVLVRTSEAYFKMMTLTKEHDLEEAKYVCMKILKLVKKTCVQNFIKQANSLLKHILHKERNFARDVLIEIKGWVRDFMEKDIYSFKNDLATEYKQNFSECAKGTQFMLLNLMNYVRQGQPQITELLQQQIIAILQYYFSSSETDPQNRDDGLELLEKFLFDNFNRATVSPQIIKLCRYIVIKLSGVPPKIITRLKRDPSSIICEQNNHVLYYQCEQQCLYGLKNYHSIMKSFIRFFNYGQPIRPIKDINNTLLQPSTNNAQLIIYLAYKFFSPKEGSDTLRQGKCFSLLMLIYYYEHHQRKDCTQRIHQSIHQFTFNVIQLSFGSYQTNPIFVKYTSQLFALWINQLKEGSFKYLSTIKKEDLAKFLNNVFLFNGGEQIKILREFQQKSRLVCGICQLFRLTLSNPALWQYLTFQTLSQLMQILITMMSEQMQQITISSSDKQVNQPHQAYQQQLYQNFIEQKQDSSIKDDEQEDYQFQATSNTDNSFNFEEDLSLMESLPYDAETDCMILLTTLYQLYTHNQQLYWKMIDEIDCNDDICTILQGSGCFDEESKYYLKVLCKMEEWTEETD